MTHPVPPAAHQPGRNRPFTVADPRLTMLLQREPERCASVNEYARATGIKVEHVLSLLDPGVDALAIRFESVGGEIFINTAPQGRPVPPGVPEAAPNLWERLRAHGNKHEAYQLWQIVRGMEAAGWVVESNTARIMFSLSPVHPVPELGVVVSNRVFPIVIHPSLADLGTPGSRFDQLSRAGASVVTLLVDSGALDETVTAVRRLWLAGCATSTSALILEGPRFNPVQVQAGDAAVAARSVTRLTPPDPA